MVTELDQQQQSALDIDFEIDSVAVCGASGSGKTTTLVAHLRRSLNRGPGRILAMTPVNVNTFRALLRDTFTQDELRRMTVCTPLQFALLQRQLLPKLELLDAYAAEETFTRAAAPLLETTWPTIENGEVDPEVSGLRSPQRFLSAAFRLMMKLSASAIDPTSIEESALRATTQFYAQPPNFADAELMRAIKEEHRSSLRVDRSMLDHQRKREIDLTRIVATLFADFAKLCEREACVTETGFLQMLTAHLTAVPAQAEIIRRRFTAVVIDDAQDIQLAELAFLKSLWGEKLTGVMMAGDIHATMMSFRGARAQATLSTPEQQVILHARRRGTVELIDAQQTIYAHPDAPSIPPAAISDANSIGLERCADAQAQAEAIAAFIGEQLNRGFAPGDCAVALRTLRCSTTIVEALLAHDIPVDYAGDIDFTSDATTMDFIALLWSIVSPEARPDAVLRLLGSDLLRLSDRSIAVLCSPPQDPMLFTAEPAARGRDKGNRTQYFLDNVYLGVNDHALSGIAQQRLTTLREQIVHWRKQVRSLSLREFLTDVVTESGIACGRGVRARLSKNLISRVISALAHRGHENNAENLVKRLPAWYARAVKADEDCVMEQIDADAVCVTSVAALRGRSFASIAIADARAGAFPRYFVPEAMLYSPQRGFIGRENAGSITSARTAKFTWYFEKTRVRDAYNSEERRAFTYALGRASRSALITAWGPATRGRTAPEFLEELRGARKARTRKA